MSLPHDGDDVGHHTEIGQGRSAPRVADFVAVGLPSTSTSYNAHRTSVKLLVLHDRRDFHAYHVAHWTRDHHASCLRQLKRNVKSALHSRMNAYAMLTTVTEGSLDY